MDYQTGNLSEAQCAIIAAALAVYATSDACGNDAAEAAALANMFADPANNLIELSN